MSAEPQQESPTIYPNSDLWDLSIELHDRPRSLSFMPEYYQSSGLRLMPIVPILEVEDQSNLPEQKLDLLHRVHIQYSKLDWVLMLLYLSGLYGFLVLMTYLLLLATKTDSHMTGIVHFALLLFTVCVTVLLIVVAEIKQRRRKQGVTTRVKRRKSVSNATREG